MSIPFKPARSAVAPKVSLKRNIAENAHQRKISNAQPKFALYLGENVGV
jgi:hypothetical protein